MTLSVAVELACGVLLRPGDHFWVETYGAVAGPFVCARLIADPYHGTSRVMDDRGSRFDRDQCHASERSARAAAVNSWQRLAADRKRVAREAEKHLERAREELATLDGVA